MNEARNGRRDDSEGVGMSAQIICLDRRFDPTSAEAEGRYDRVARRINQIRAARNRSQREADELEARMFQHEIDHLLGVLMFDRMSADQRKQALTEYRRLEEQASSVEAAPGPLRRRLGLG